jgi:hypothetical protein
MWLEVIHDRSGVPRDGVQHFADQRFADQRVPFMPN